MDTKWQKISGECMDEDVLKEAGRIVRNGGLVAFPTETVYGLGGDALNPDSSRKIYAAKGRPSDNPLIVHIADMEDLPRLVSYIPDAARVLAEHFWPGPLTMIFQKSNIVPYETTGGLDTVAVRFPSNPTAQKFIKEAGGYVAAPSANTSGRPSPTKGKHVYEDLNGKIDMLLDGGDCDIGLESTIVDLTEDIPVILRPGYITEEMLSEVLERVDTDRTILSAASGIAPKAPGMKYRHYAPHGDLVIVKGETDSVISYVNKQIEKDLQEHRKVGVIATDETIDAYGKCVKKSVGKRSDEASIARRLYEILREFDREAVEDIYAEAFESTGMGQAIMNRMLKAAGHKVIEV
ncbi:MAG: L-threonylcarbamoyladenylate synthase [Lachnospiraceae bacterium]